MLDLKDYEHISIHFFVTSELLPLIYVPISLLGRQTGPKSTKVRFNAQDDSLSFGGGRAMQRDTHIFGEEVNLGGVDLRMLSFLGPIHIVLLVLSVSTLGGSPKLYSSGGCDIVSFTASVVDGKKFWELQSRFCAG